MQGCEPGYGNMRGALEVPRQSSLGAAALDYQHPGERIYASFNQFLLPSVPGQSCLADTCSHTLTHECRQTYIYKRCICCQAVI